MPIRVIKKLLLVFLAIFVVTFLSLFFLKDRLVKSIVNAGLSKAIGVPIQLEGFSWDILNSVIEIKGLKIYNPDGFPKEVMLVMPSIKAEYDLSAFLKKELHLPWAELDLREVILSREAGGKLNLQELKTGDKKAAAQTSQKEQEAKAWPLHIELFKLKLGRIVYKDFSSGGKPIIQAYEVNINKAYKNISGLKQLLTLMLADSLRPTALKGAAIYGLVSLTGAQLLPPVGVAAVLTGRDGAKAGFPTDTQKAFTVSLEALDEVGDIVKHDDRRGVIKGKIHSIEVIIKISRIFDKEVTVAVSARKYLIPKPHIAEGLLYHISEKLK
ncbi:MAG: AsmA family protein [Candidatus Omnitrophica bacterium]|nr:AsmA family protein [Candidatus Omnitrophota bacterium]